MTTQELADRLARIARDYYAAVHRPKNGFTPEQLDLNAEIHRLAFDVWEQAKAESRSPHNLEALVQRIEAVESSSRITSDQFHAFVDRVDGEFAQQESYWNALEQWIEKLTAWTRTVPTLARRK